MFRRNSPRRKVRRGFQRLFVEALEDRLAPAAVSWTGNAGTLNWGDANNWSNNLVPTSADDVTISKSGVGTINIGAGTFAVRTLNDTTAGLAIASGGSLSLAAVVATSTLGQSVTVNAGAALTVGAGAGVVMQPGVALTDSGTLTFNAGDSVTFGYASNATTQIVVNASGVASASGTAFTEADNRNLTQVYVNGGGHLTASNCTFTLTQVYLDNGSAVNAGDLVGNAFDSSLFLPASDVQYLSGSGSNNLRFQDIDILGGSLGSGQTVALNAIGTATTAKLRYVFPGAFTVQAGAAINVAANVPVLIQPNQTLTDSGTLTFATGDAVSFGYISGNGTSQIVLNAGGVLSAAGTTFATVDSRTPSQIYVNGGGHLQANGCTFTLTQVYLDNGSVLNAGDFAGNGFDSSLFLPAALVPSLSGPGSDNLRFQDIDILAGTLTGGQTVALNAIGTATTAKLRYVFPGNFTVASGATLTIGTNANVLISSQVTITDNGTLTVTSAAAVVANENGYGVFGIVVNGTMNASGTAFTRSGGNYGSSALQVKSGGHLTASNCTFAWAQFSLANGSVLNSGDLTTNGFDTPVYAPLTDVPLLTNNRRFQDVNLYAGGLAGGQSLTLTPIGTDTTANQRYVFYGYSDGGTFLGSYTVSAGATLTFGTNANVLISSQVTITDNGTLTVTSAAPVVANENGYGVFGIVVNGTMNASGTAFTRSGGNYGSSALQVKSGGHLTAGNCTFAWSSLSLANGSVLNSGDLTTNGFDTPVYAPLTDVPLLASNRRFQDINLYTGSLTSGQSLTLTPIGTDTTANQRYVFYGYSDGGTFLGSYTVSAGATLTLGTNANVLISSQVTITDNGTLTVTSAAPVVANENGYGVFGIVVNGTMSASGTSFTRTGGNYGSSAVQVSATGHLTASNCTFAWSSLSLANGSTLNSGDLTTNGFDLPITVPTFDVPLLANNRRFQDVNLLTATFTGGQSLTLTPLGTDTTANQRYVFVGAITLQSGAALTLGTGAYVVSAAITVQSGATLTVQAGANVVISSQQTITDNGTLSVTGATVVANENGYGTFGIVVNGTMSASGTAFTRTGGNYGSSAVQVGATGHLTAGNCTFAWSTFSLIDGSVLNGGDLTGNGFDTPVYAPLADVPLLANNRRFRDVNLYTGSLGSGQSLTLAPLGTDTTANQRYVFYGYNSLGTFVGSYAVNAGATLAFGTGANVLISSQVTITDSGTLNVTGAAAVEANENGYGAFGIVVNGTMNASGTAFTRTGGNFGSSTLRVNANGHLTLTGGSFNWANLVLNSGSIDALHAAALTTQLAINSGAVIGITGDDFSNATVVASGDPNATIDLRNNYWGTTNAAQIAAKITDHVKDATRPTVLYNPYLSAPPVALTGIVFNDLNGNGVRDGGEPGLAGVLVYLDLNNNGAFDLGEPYTVTQADDPTTPGVDETGQYRFDGLAAGTYVVREVPPAGYAETVPSAAAVATTIFFDGTGAEAGITGAGIGNFAFMGAGFSGGIIFAPSTSALYASGKLAYNASAGTTAVDFSRPMGSVSFFYVHGSGFAAGTATAYAADGTILGSVGSKAATTSGDPNNFVTLAFAHPIARLTFSGGIIDNFTFTTAANDQAYYVPTHAGQTFVGITFADYAATTVAAANAGATFSTAAQNVSLSAAVTSTAGTVSEGTVTFTLLNGTTVVGNPVTANVSNGAAAATYVLPAGTAGGTYTIKAVYNGTSNYGGAGDSSHLLTVSAAAAANAAANATATYSAASQAVSLSATVTSTAGTVNEGTETFTILNGNTVVGSAVTVNVSAGAASTNYTLPAGTAPATYTIKAVYSGTGNFLGSTDTSHTLTVNSATGATVSIGLDPNSNSGAPNHPGYTNVTTPTFDVQVNQAGTITVDFDGNAAHDQTRTVSGAGTYQFTAPTLADGAYTATATLNAGLSGSPQSATSCTIDTVPPHVASMTPAATVNTGVSQVLVTFSELVDLQSFAPSAITLTGPGGTITVSQPQLVSGSTYSLGFAAQTGQGAYTLVIAATVTDFAANAMGKSFSGSFTIALPDLAVTSTSAPTTAVEGASIPIAWQVTNLSATNPTGASWMDAVYLSTKSVLDNTAVPLIHVAAPPTAPLAPTANYSRAASVAVPGNLATGNYYVLFVADDNGGQPESDGGNDTNDVVADPITLLAPDLQVTGVSGPTHGFTGQSVLVTWTDVNTGTAAATGSWVDNVYTGTDAQGHNPTLLGSFTFTGTLAVGASVQRTQQVILPQTAGTNWFLVTTNATQTVPEGTSFGNNTTVAAASISIAAVPAPDLVVTAITPPANGVFSGSTVPVSFVVKNKGTAPTSVPVWHDWVILSQDPNLAQTYQGQLNGTGPGGDQTLNNQPVILGFDNPSYLGVGESYQQSVTLPLPISAQGTWYVYVVPDGTGAYHPFAMPELSRADKLAISAGFSVTLSPPPDLVASGVQAPAQNFSGQPMKLSWTVTNGGTGPTAAGAWTDAVYLSPVATLGAGATLLGTFAHQGVLAVGGSYTSSQTVNLPVGVSGSFYFLVKTDLNEQVFENGATANNVAATATAKTVNLTPPPDLTVSAITSPATAQAGHGFSFSYTVTNAGAGATPNYTWDDALYLSPTATFNAGTAISLGRQTHQGSLAAGAHYTNAVTVALPNGLAGAYYVFVTTDSGNVVFELDKTNNGAASTGATQISLALPDLVVSAASAPAAALPGSAILVSWTVTNQSTGDTAVTSWRDSVYADTGTTLSGNAVLLGSFAHYGLLSGGSSYTQAPLLTVPINLLGNYNLFVVANSSGDVYESNTGNNTSAPVPITISLQVTGQGGTLQADVSDLQVTSVTGTAVTGSVTVSWTVQNKGTGATNATYWDDDVWLSTKATLGSGGTDVYLGTIQRTNPVAAGASYSFSGTFAVPSALAAGSYYYLVATDRPVVPPNDPDNEGVKRVYESNPSNNVTASSAAATVTPAPLPDLTVSNVTVPATATSGEQLSVSWTVTNGGADTGNVPITDSVYLSYDQVFDPSDLYVGSVTYAGGLGSGASVTRNATLQLPSGVAGTFTVFVVTNSNHAVAEKDTTNNSAYGAQPVQIQLSPLADLVAGTVTIPASAVAGQDITITYQVTNNGGNPANGSWYDSLYLAPVPAWDVSDSLLGTVPQTQNLAPNGSYTGTLTAPLPGVAPGSYYVLLRTNILDNLPEQTLINNLSASLTRVALDAPALTLGTATNGTLNQGQAVYCKVVVSAGQTLQVALTGQNAAAFNELYVSFGTMPTRSQYDFRFSQAFGPNQQVTVPTTQAGAYYILAYGATVPGAPENYSITAAVVPFSVQAVTPGQAGAGPVTLRISGAQFDFATTFQLRNSSGKVLAATRTLLQDSATAFATFDLTGQALGSWDVWAVQSGGATTELAAGLGVVAPTPSNRVRLGLDGPQVVLVGRPGTVTVTCDNPGNTDLPAPLILLDGHNALFQAPGQAGYSRSALQLYGFNPAGPFGTLPPGFQGSITVSFKPVTAGAGIASGFALSTLQDPSQPFDWAAVAANDVPANTSATQWSALVGQAAPLIGSTWGAVVAFLGSDSVQLVKNAGAKTDPVALNSLYDFDGLLQYAVGVYGSASPTAATPPFAVVASEGEVTVYNANVDGGGNPVPLNASYPTFVIVPGFGGYRSDYGALAGAIAADANLFPNGHVNVLIATWQGAMDGPTIAGIPVPWVAALHVDTDAAQLGDLLGTLNRQGKIGISTTTVVAEGFGDDVGYRAAKIAGGLGGAIALDEASPLGGYLPSALKDSFQHSAAYETTSFLDAQLSLAASNQTLATGDDNNPFLQHTSGVPWLTGQILVGNDAALRPGPAAGQDALPPRNDPPPPSSPTRLPVSSSEVVQIIPHDPNSIIGPKGSGTNALVATSDPLPYSILFTNLATAQAPAQQVVVKQQLSSNLAWGSFRLGNFGFGGQIYSVPADSAYYQTTIDLTQQFGFDVEVTATIDESTGVATWTFITIDPATGDVPLDPTVGFLPPDNGNGAGEGFVSYTIQAASADTTGTVIAAQATVIFDTAPPLNTPVIFNTVDAGGGLTSSVAPLPAVENTNQFNVFWSGSDASNGSGIAYYTIYVSDNGGPFVTWLADTPLTSAPFVGQVGHDYGFFSVATDYAGNVQPAPAGAQAGTLVHVPSTTALTSSLNPSYAGIPVTFTATVAGPVGTPSGSVSFYDFGVALAPAVALSAGVATLTTSALGGGTHFITAAYGGSAGFASSTASTFAETVRQGFKAGDVLIEQVGTPGSPAPAAGTAAPVLLTEYGPATANQASPVNVVALPIAGTGGSTPNALTTAYGDSLQGLLHLSVNGSYLTLAGYNAAPGTAHVAATSTAGAGAVVRVVGRIDGNGTVDTTTSTTDYSGQPVFAAVSGDGGKFYVAGGGTGSAPGLRYLAALGQAGAAVGLQDGAPGGSQIIASPLDAALGDGTLYASAAGNLVYYGTPGTVPTTSGQNTTTLPGLNGTTFAQPLGLVVLDAGNTGSANLVYLADQTNGLEKFALTGGIWLSEGTIAGHFSGLAGAFEADGTTVDLYATTGTGAGGNTLVKLVDAAGATGTISGTLTTLATAGSGTAFRGVALAPALTATMTTLTSTPNPTGTASGHNGVTYTATVAASSGTPTGTVNFYDGGVLAGSGTLSTVGGNQVATFSTTYTAAGTHSMIAAYLGTTAFAVSDTAALTQTVIPPATVTGVVVNGNSAALAGAQRSMVNSLVYTFDHAVTLAAGAFTIALHQNVTVNGKTGQTVGTLPTLGWVSSNGGLTWTVTFSGAGVVNGSIADGVYDLTLHAAAVTDVTGQALSADRVDTFYRLFGDADGNQKVNNADLAAFSGAFNKRSNQAAYLAYLDYDGSGRIDNGDLAQFSARFNSSFGGF